MVTPPSFHCWRCSGRWMGCKMAKMILIWMLKVHLLKKRLTQNLNML